MQPPGGSRSAYAGGLTPPGCFTPGRAAWGIPPSPEHGADGFGEFIFYMGRDDDGGFITRAPHSFRAYTCWCSRGIRHGSRRRGSAAEDRNGRERAHALPARRAAHIQIIKSGGRLKC